MNFIKLTTRKWKTVHQDGKEDGEYVSVPVYISVDHIMQVDVGYQLLFPDLPAKARVMIQGSDKYGTEVVETVEQIMELINENRPKAGPGAA